MFTKENLTYRNVVSGLEGCGKSSAVFALLEKDATPDRPLLVSVKNYKLMTEQIDNWSDRFKIPKAEFAICGFNRFYEPALQAYTNPRLPEVIPEKARIVFCSQSLIQRNRHKRFLNTNTHGLPVCFSHILVDEFDYTSGIIPTLDYQLSNVRIDRRDLENYLLNWVRKNYTEEDLSAVLQKHLGFKSEFLLAHWIKESDVPITFLTSEQLATLLLEKYDFTKFVIDEEVSFKSCVVNVWSNPWINSAFFNNMNRKCGWAALCRELKYDVLISDCVSSFYRVSDRQEEELTVQSVSHTGVKGSNNWIGKNILTIMSHIPPQVIAELQNVLLYLNTTISYSEVEALYYRDRLCQAIGRVLGYRGGKSTDVVIHERLLETIKDHIVDFPYTLDEQFDFDFSLLKEVLKATKEDNDSKPIVPKIAIDTSFELDDYFELDSKSYLTPADIKEHLKSVELYTSRKKQYTYTATTVASHFGLKLSTKKVDGKRIRVVNGLRRKSVNAMSKSRSRPSFYSFCESSTTYGG
jgi:hypothetical protein